MNNFEVDEAIHHILWMLWFEYGDLIVEGVEIKGSISLVAEFLETKGYADIENNLFKINKKAIVLMDEEFDFIESAQFPGK